MNKQNIEQFFAILAQTNPNPRTELKYSSSFELLVAVILSAQATDVGVNKATTVLFKLANTPEQIVALGYDQLCQYIKTIGLYRTKAKNIIATAQILLDEYQGQIPATRAQLEQLPGVGRKTANVILNVAFGQPTMAVDTHIFRLGNRTGLAKGKTPLEVELKLLNRIPQQYLRNAHHWLILHGRYICQARQPKCQICALSRCCDYYKKSQSTKIANYQKTTSLISQANPKL